MSTPPSFNRLASLAAAVMLSQASAQVVINELDADNPGTDTLEFIELYDGGTGNTSLDGMVLVLFNGGNTDASYRAVDLAGQSTNADGFFVVGGNAVAGNYGIEVGLPFEPDPNNNVSNLLQNGADGVALLSGTAADFPNGTPVNDAIVTNNIIDAVVYGTADGDDFELIDALLLADQLQVDEAANGDKDNESIQRVPDGGTPRSTASYVTKAPTPGALNDPAETLTLSATLTSFSEAAGTAASTGTVTRSGPTTGDVVVSLSLSNSDNHVDNTEFLVPTTVTIPDGSAFATFEIDALDDRWPDGSQTITIAASGPGFQEATPLDVTVEDDGADGYLVAINEFYPTVLLGTDTNGDDFADTDNNYTPFGANPDDFVEFVNVSGAQLDISGWTITDLFIDERPGFTPVHTFPAGTVIDPGCAVVVFGSGVSPEGLNPNFGDAIVQNAANGALFLNESDRISVKDESGLEIIQVTYFNQDGFDGSSTLSSEGDQTSGYLGHFPEFGTDVSPGTMGDGTPFCQVDNALSITATTTTITENDGPGATTLTITRAPDTNGALLVSLGSSDESELTVPASVTIPDGFASVEVAADAVDDFGPDGSQSVTVTAQAPGFSPGTITIQVDDDGDIAPTNLVINEIDSDQPGDENQEFVEIYNPNPQPASLTGFVLAFYNGTNNSAGSLIEAIPLEGDIPANGFFVIGDVGVPNVNLVPASFSDSSNIQNGIDAVALFAGAPAVDFDGTTADLPPLDAILVNGVVYNNSGSGNADLLLAALDPDGELRLEGGSNNTNSISRTPDGSNTFAQLSPSPGSPNGFAPAGFDAWAAANGIPGAGRLDDSDFDNIPAVVEYVLGLDPTVADSDNLPSLVPAGADYTIAFQLGAEASADGSVTPVIETSTDMKTWTTLASTNNGTTITATIPGDSGDLYVRLMVLQAIP